MKKKRLIFHISELASWVSCQTIASNLRQSYLSLDGTFEEICLDLTQLKNANSLSKLIYLNNLCKKIKNINPKYLYFVEFEPLQLNIVWALRTNPITKEMKFYYTFQTYADLALYSKNWIQISQHLLNEKVRFILASEKEASIAKSFLKNPGGLVQYCPFSVDSNFFSFNEKQRNKTRNSLGLKSTDRLIIYTGRISLQKNIHLIIENFEKISILSDYTTHLYIIGSYDDHGAEFTGLFTPLGWYYNKIQNALMKISPDSRSKIKIYRFKGPEFIRDMLNAADLFWSLSIHHNEDFGMSVAEALSCGLPCVVTNWAGYSSFNVRNILAKFVEVKLTKNNSFLINQDNFIKYSLELLQLNLAPDLRKKKSLNFASSFSINSVGKQFNKINSSRWFNFTGFKSHLKEQSTRLYINLPTKKKSLYEKIYQPYFSKEV